MEERRLLVVDDEPRFGEYVRKVAEGLGFEVEVTTDGESFMKAYERFRPTVIGLDMVMPGRDGLSLVEWLMLVRCTARIIIMTGFNPGHAALAQLIAARHHAAPIRVLTKPFPMAELKAALLA